MKVMTAKELKEWVNNNITPENENAEVWVFTSECCEACTDGIGFNKDGDLCIGN